MEPTGVSWPERYRRALESSAPGTAVVLDEEHVAALLRLAREVAHGTERRYAPIATFLAGQYVAACAHAGAAGTAAALEAAEVLARDLLSEGEGGPAC